MAEGTPDHDRVPKQSADGPFPHEAEFFQSGGGTPSNSAAQ
jgi:hypothetical protein